MQDRHTSVRIMRRILRLLLTVKRQSPNIQVHQHKLKLLICVYTGVTRTKTQSQLLQQFVNSSTVQSDSEIIHLQGPDQLYIFMF